MASQVKVDTQRKNYPKKKRMLYQELQELPGTYDVIALSKMSKVRATQLMTIRKKFRGEIKIRVIKNRVAQRAFEKLSNRPGLDYLSKELEGQCALLFTNISPFKLNLIFICITGLRSAISSSTCFLSGKNFAASTFTASWPFFSGWATEKSSLPYFSVQR